MYYILAKQVAAERNLVLWEQKQAAILKKNKSKFIFRKENKIKQTSPVLNKLKKEDSNKILRKLQLLAFGLLLHKNHYALKFRVSGMALQ